MKKLLEENINTGTLWDKIFDNEIIKEIDRVALHRFKMISEEIEENSKVLDVGCGKGEMLRYLDKYKYNMRLHGCDISKVAVDYCQKQMPKSKFKTLDIKDIREHYKENQFNYIVCEEVLEHIDNPKQLIEDMRFILKKKCKLILAVPYKNRVIGEHIWSLSIKDFTDMLENKDWEIEKIIKYYHHRNLFITAIKQ